MKRQQNVAMNMKFPLGGNCLLENWLNFGNGGQTQLCDSLTKGQMVMNHLYKTCLNFIVYETTTKRSDEHEAPVRGVGTSLENQLNFGYGDQNKSLIM